MIEIGGRFAAAEDAARLRDALGWAIPQGLPSAFTDPVERPLDDVVARYARTHVPFTIEELTARFDISVERARAALDPAGSRRSRSCSASSGPGGVEREWCDTNVLRILRRRSLAALRHEIEPVDAATYARFLGAWQGAGRGNAGHRRAGGGARTAAGRGDPGLGARTRRAPGTGRRLPARHARRVVRGG